MNKRREKAIVAELLRFRKNSSNEAGNFLLDPNSEEHKLVDENPLAFVIGCVLDRQTDAEKAWVGPYKLQQRIGNLSFSSLRKLTPEDWKKHLGPQKGDPETIHRFWKNVMPKSLHSAMRVIDRYSNGSGDARCLWTGDNLHGDDVVCRFKKIWGVDDKIANMAVRMLVTEFNQPIKKDSIDVSVDVHVSRVFPRLGLVQVDECATKRSIKKLIVEKARELHPKFPAEIDPPIFIIGKNFCDEEEPKCDKCPMEKLCDYARVAAA